MTAQGDEHNLQRSGALITKSTALTHPGVTWRQPPLLTYSWTPQSSLTAPCPAFPRMPAETLPCWNTPTICVVPGTPSWPGLPSGTPLLAPTHPHWGAALAGGKLLSLGLHWYTAGIQLVLRGSVNERVALRLPPRLPRILPLLGHLLEYRVSRPQLTCIHSFNTHHEMSWSPLLPANYVEILL